MVDHSADLLDLSNMSVIYALASLDTEMNQLHKLCIEQGPFFKAFFPLAVSDSQRSALKEHAPHQSPNASHLLRTYWKSKIFVYEIQNIGVTYTNVLKEWSRLYLLLSDFKVNPAVQWNTQVLPDTSLKELNTNLTALIVNISKACEYLASFAINRNFSSGNRRVYVQPASASLDSLLEKLETAI